MRRLTIDASGFIDAVIIFYHPPHQNRKYTHYLRVVRMERHYRGNPNPQLYAAWKKRPSPGIHDQEVESPSIQPTSRKRQCTKVSGKGHGSPGLDPLLLSPLSATSTNTSSWSHEYQRSWSTSLPNFSMGSFSIPSTPGSDRELISSFTATNFGLSTDKGLGFKPNGNHEETLLAPSDIVVQDDGICIGRVRTVS